MHTPQQHSHQTPDPYSHGIRSNQAGLATPGGPMGSSSGGLTPIVANRPTNSIQNTFSAFVPPSSGGLNFPSRQPHVLQSSSGFFNSRLGQQSSGTPRVGVSGSAFNPPSVGLGSVIEAVGISRQQSIQSTPHRGGETSGLESGPNATPAGSSSIQHAPRTPLSLAGGRLDEQPMSTATTGTTVMPVPQLQNIVCTVDLKCNLDLKRIALRSRNAEYNPKRFAAVIMRIREPRTTALIFSSGKMVCTGAKSEEAAKNAARKYARIIQKLNFEMKVEEPTKFKDFKIQNMVASCDVGFPLRLEGLTVSHTKFSTYEPELFPGLIYRMTKPKIVLLLFVSGKVVLTGAKEKEEIYEAFRNIYPVLKGFRKATTS